MIYGDCRAFVFVRTQVFVYFSTRIFIFYFTQSLFKNTPVRLSTLYFILLKYCILSIFYYYLKFSLSLSLYIYIYMSKKWLKNGFACE